MKCSNCGSNIPGSAKFCGVCGTATQPAEAESALDTVAFDPSSDPEFKAAAAKLEAENKKANAQTAEAKKEAESAQKAVKPAQKAVKPAQKAAKPAQKAAKPAQKLNKPAPAKVASKPSSEPSKAPLDADAEVSDGQDEDATAKKKGKFRETIWFMQAEDPEMMSSIESEHLEEREATYQDPVGNLDERSREKFSLNISESSMMKAVDRQSLDVDDSPENAKSWFYASVVIGTISVGYIIYLAIAK
jgi:hypothetical protein